MAVVINGIVYEDLVQLAAQKDALNLSYWKGDSRIVSVVVPEEVTAIVGDLTIWPNVTEVIVANHDSVVTGLDTKFANVGGITYWVADDMITAYEIAYPTLTFDTWPNYDTWTIPYLAGETPTTLTAAYVQSEFAKNPAAHYATKVVVPTYFTDYSAGALDAIFDGITNMETIESPWLNGTKTDGMEWLVPYVSGETSTTLTSSYIAEVIQADSTALGYVEKVVVPSYFTGLGSNAFVPFATKLKEVAIESPDAINSIQPDSPQMQYGKRSTAFDGLSQKITLTFLGTGIVLGNGLFADIAGLRFEKMDFSKCTDYTRLWNQTFADYNPVNQIILGKGFARAALGNAAFGNSGLFFNANCSEISFTFERTSNVASSIFFCLDGVLELNSSNVLSTTITTDKNISYSDVYTREDLLKAINALYDYSGGTQHTLTMGATNLAKLTAEDIAIATAKNWTIA